MSTGAIAAYRKNGRFADGSVLVKEVFEATTGAMTTGTVISHAQPLTWLSLSRRPTRVGRPALLHQFSLAVHLDDLESEGYGIYGKPPSVHRPFPCRSIDTCPSRSTQEEFLKWKNHLASP